MLGVKVNYALNDLTGGLPGLSGMLGKNTKAAEKLVGGIIAFIVTVVVVGAVIGGLAVLGSSV
ncbi:MAG: hypothetical protein PUE47_05470 [Lachnospiraceae bacterium]|nr:hypothetical protein [Lachnospiraceae bacterium]